MRLDLPVLTLLVLSLPLCARAQSLGDVARETREERQQSGVHATRVVTNDDLPKHQAAKPAPAPEKDAESSEAGSEAKSAAKSDETKSTTPGKETSAAKEGEKASAKECTGEDCPKVAQKAAAKKTAEQEREDRENEFQKRSDEINKTFTDRLQKLRDDLTTAQLQLTRLETQQVDNTNEFKRTAAMSPTLNEYEAQQKEFIAEIAAQKELIHSLEGQLEDAKEAAHHAGVPHASD